MNPSSNWRIFQVITKYRIAKAQFESIKFLSDISSSLSEIVDRMLYWYHDHEDLLNYDEQNAYLSTVGEIQGDISYFQRVAKRGICECDYFVQVEEN